MQDNLPLKTPLKLTNLLFLAVGIAVGIVFGAFTLLTSTFDTPNPLLDDEKVDAIICLAGGKGRIEYSVELLKQGRGKYLFLSGTGPNFDTDSLKTLLPTTNLDRFRDRIEIDPISTSTMENAINALSFARRKQIKTIVLVTSDYHLQRATLIFKNVFPDHFEIKTGSPPSSAVTQFNWWKSWLGIKLVFWEWVKWIRTRWAFSEPSHQD